MSEGASLTMSEVDKEATLRDYAKFLSGVLLLVAILFICVCVALAVVLILHVFGSTRHSPTMFSWSTFRGVVETCYVVNYLCTRTNVTPPSTGTTIVSPGVVIWPVWFPYWEEEEEWGYGYGWGWGGRGVSTIGGEEEEGGVVGGGVVDEDPFLCTLVLNCSGHAYTCKFYSTRVLNITNAIPCKVNTGENLALCNVTRVISLPCGGR